MGAVVSVVLLIPAVAAFLIDRVVTRRQTALLSARAVPYAPKPNPWVDRGMLLYCLSITYLTLAILGMAQFAAAMAMLIVYACAVVRILHAFVTGWLLARVQAWRRL